MTQDQIDDEAAAIARRYRQLGAMVDELQEEQKALQTRFRDLVPAGYALDVDGKVACKSAPARAFHLVTALDVARTHGIPVTFVEVADQADLKARLRAAGRMDICMVPGAGAERVVLA